MRVRKHDQPKLRHSTISEEKPDGVPSLGIAHNRVKKASFHSGPPKFLVNQQYAAVIMAPLLQSGNKPTDTFEVKENGDTGVDVNNEVKQNTRSLIESPEI